MKNLNPIVLGACIGAIPALVAAFVGYQAGEKRHELERAKWFSEMSFRIRALPDPQAYGVMGDLCLATDAIKRSDAEVFATRSNTSCNKLLTGGRP